MIKKEGATCVPILPAIAERWSGKAFDPQKKIEQNKLFALVEAARWAPSCYGAQPWRYVLVRRENHTWQDALDALAEANKKWAMHSNILAIAVADSRFEWNNQENKWASYDTGASTMSLVLQATALGLMVHQMGGFSAEKISEALGIPKRFIPMSVIAIGYQLPKDQIPKNMLEDELKPRKRNPIGEHFFDGLWGESLNTY